ncbi:MAG TPA: bifunctional YncE family protein/alkaline phosphatase family protein [Candidatus Angelobacter sp.]|nr:bifunctional YncE family protein/alkaline phosphatase family protein [Candidatus Angelobacter sp.]
MICALGWAPAGFVQERGSQAVTYATPLATGNRLDPVGEFIDLGSMPLNMALAPGGKQLVAVLSGWREQGIQVIDLESLKVTQTIEQDAAFFGLAFSQDGKKFYVSGGNEDLVYAYSWNNGSATLEKKIVLGEKKADKTGSRYPAGIAAAKHGNLIYVAENVGDSLAVVDPAAGRVVQRFPTDHYPYAVEAAADGNVYVSAWGDSTLSTFHALGDGTLSYTGRIAAGARPSAMVANGDGSRLYVAMAEMDAVAVVDTGARRVLTHLRDQAPDAPSQGSTPSALALSADGSRLYVAEAGNNAVAVFDLRAAEAGAGRSLASPIARIPADWYPTAVLETDKTLLILSGKGHGSHANPDGPTPGEAIKRPLGYALGQLNGTLRTLSAALSSATMAQYTRRVEAANGWEQKREARKYPPFKHVVYIIKENRTYDQVFGDLKEGDGDPRLSFYGEKVWANHHALARRFGLFDRFFTNAEVSSQGHIWSTAAYVTDYGEKTIPSLYSNRRADVDGEEADEPLGGFLWDLAVKKGIWFRDYGEMVTGPEGWPVTQRRLRADVSPVYPEFNLKIPDQKRVDGWIQELEEFTRKGKMPALEVLHLPSDHTAGGRAGYPTPRAYMADNDLALGRLVEALSHTPFWRDTVVFVLEDDSQAGPDHVDAHRSAFLAISAYSRPGTIHRFANTTDVVAAIEDILGLDRLSKFDYFSRSLADVFAADPDLTPYKAVVPEADMKEMNPSQGAEAQMSEGLDLSAPDRINDDVFNHILWYIIKAESELPAIARKAPMHAMQIAR